MTPFNALRLQAAREQLQRGEPLDQVAELAGLPSVYQFSWRYYCYFGYWPTQDQPRPIRRTA